MSELEPPRVRVRLEGLMSEAQIEIVSDHVVGQLVGQAGDLDRLDQYLDPAKAVAEVATLGRLAFWLDYREILVPDPDGEELMRRAARELVEMDQTGGSTGGDPPAEHDAMWAYVGLFSDWPSGAEVHDTLWESRQKTEPRERKPMTRDGGPFRIRLDGLSEGQIAILREGAADWLVTKADDLPKGAGDAGGTRREVEEVAALGRLASGLRRGEVLVPDPIARRLVARTTGETLNLDELREEYDRELGEHEAWVALLDHLDGAPDVGPAEAGEGDDCGVEPGPLDGAGPGTLCSPRVELTGRLSEDQLRIVLKEVTGTLAGRTDDLPILSGQADQKRQFAEIAALARLAFWLVRGEVEVPDRVAHEMVERLAEGSKDLAEWQELRERHEAAIAEHEALVALAGIFSHGPPSPGDDDA